MEEEATVLLQRKLNRSLNRLKPSVISIEEMEMVLNTIDDLSKRVVALEKENTSLSLYNFQRVAI